MYRVIAIVVGGLALAACSSNSKWFEPFKSGPTMETVRFESEPPGAEAKLSNGQTCRTPCALAVPHPEAGGYTVTFTLSGFLPDTEQIALQSMGDGTAQLRPNPVVAQLTAPPPPPKKKVRRRHVAKPAAKKPRPAEKPKPAAARAAPSMQPQPAPSPWPAAPPPQR